jgi:hypothetical protein
VILQVWVNPAGNPTVTVDDEPLPIDGDGYPYLTLSKSGNGNPKVVTIRRHQNPSVLAATYWNINGVEIPSFYDAQYTFSSGGRTAGVYYVGYEFYNVSVTITVTIEE